MAVDSLPNLSKWGNCKSLPGKQGSFFEHSNSSELHPMHLLQLQYIPSPQMPKMSLAPPHSWSGPWEDKRMVRTICTSSLTHVAAIEFDSPLRIVEHRMQRTLQHRIHICRKNRRSSCTILSLAVAWSTDIQNICRTWSNETLHLLTIVIDRETRRTTLEIRNSYRRTTASSIAMQTVWWMPGISLGGSETKFVHD